MCLLQTNCLFGIYSSVGVVMDSKEHLGQWFKTGGSLSLKGHLAMPGGIFGSYA